MSARKMFTMALLAGASLAGLCGPALAGTWSDLWSTHEQQGQKLLDGNHPNEAARLFSDPKRRAYAEAQAGQYGKAAELLAPMKDADSQYNRGNALARGGKLQDALAAYDAALAASPGNEDVLRNRDLVAKALENQQQQGKDGSGKKGKGQQGQGNSGQGSGGAGDKQSGGKDSGSQDGKSGQDQSQAGQPGQAGQQGQSAQQNQAGQQSQSSQQGQSAQQARAGQQGQNGNQAQANAQNQAKSGSQGQAGQHNQSGNQQQGASPPGAGNPSGQQSQAANPQQGTNPAAAGQQAQANPAQNGNSATSPNAANSARAQNTQQPAGAVATNPSGQHDQHNATALQQSQTSGTGTQQGPESMADSPLVKGGVATDSHQSQPRSEQALALDQWLRSIPDDSGELLRRKFQIEHLMKKQGNEP